MIKANPVAFHASSNDDGKNINLSYAWDPVELILLCSGSLAFFINRLNDTTLNWKLAILKDCVDYTMKLLKEHSQEIEELQENEKEDFITLFKKNVRKKEQD